MVKGGRGAGEGVALISYYIYSFFLTICISHTPWPGKRNENGKGNDLLISKECARICTNMFVWQCDRSIEI